MVALKPELVQPQWWAIYWMMSNILSESRFRPRNEWKVAEEKIRILKCLNQMFPPLELLLRVGSHRSKDCIIIMFVCLYPLGASGPVCFSSFYNKSPGFFFPLGFFFFFLMKLNTLMINGGCGQLLIFYSVHIHAAQSCARLWGYWDGPVWSHLQESDTIPVGMRLVL